MGTKNRLESLRLERGYKKAKDFAAYLDIDKSQYSKYENNRVQPNLETVLMICGKDKLDIDPRSIFHLDK